MPKSFDQAMYDCRAAADVVIQAHAENALGAVRIKFAEIAQLSEGERVAWVASSFDDLDQRTRRAYQAQVALVGSFQVDLGFVVGVRADAGPSYEQAEKDERALKVAIGVLSVFDRFSDTDFRSHADLVKDVFGWLNEVVSGDAIPEVVESRSQALAELATARAALAAAAVRSALTDLSSEAVADDDHQRRIGLVTNAIERAMLAYGVAQTFIAALISGSLDESAAVRGELQKLDVMLQTLASIDGLLDYARMFEEADFRHHEDELRELFSKMCEFVAGAVAYEPTAETLSPDQVTITSLPDRKLGGAVIDESAFAHGAMEAAGLDEFDEESLLSPPNKRSIH